MPDARPDTTPGAGYAALSIAIRLILCLRAKGLLTREDVRLLLDAALTDLERVSIYADHPALPEARRLVEAAMAQLLRPGP